MTELEKEIRKTNIKRMCATTKEEAEKYCRKLVALTETRRMGNAIR